MEELYKKSLRFLENKEFEKAIDGYNKILQTDPSFVSAWYDLASIYLLHKNFLDGFTFYEYRFLFSSHIIHRQKLPAPFYKGEDLVNKSIFIFAEQGFGDTIQFIRFIELFQEKFESTKIILYVQSALKQLLSYNFKQISFVDDFNIKEKVNYSMSLLSIPYNLQVNNIIALKQYLFIDKKDLLHSSNNKIKIGICWQGNKGNIRDTYRSIDMEKLLSSIPNKDNSNIYSLQKDIRSTHKDIIDIASQFNNFYDTAVFIQSLDYIITVDTAIAHLSGALGKPTFLLLPFLPDWRWGIDDSKSYWYEKVSIFRQETKGDWSTPLQQIQTLLKL